MLQASTPGANFNLDSTVTNSVYFTPTGTFHLEWRQLVVIESSYDVLI